jgi:asparagine synthetase B (glutamine-hydrolysing)
MTDLLYGVLDLRGEALDLSLCGSKKGERTEITHHAFFLGQQRTICNQNQSAKAIAKEGLIVGMVGEIVNAADFRFACGVNDVSDLEIVARLYAQHGFSGMHALDGVYTIALYDTNKERLFVFQDRFSSPWSLYWVETGRRLFFSNSLKRLLTLFPIMRSVDRRGFEAFVVNGFIPNERTLLRDVHKLVPGSYLTNEDRKIEVKSAPDRHPDSLEGDVWTEEFALTYVKIVEGALSRLTAFCLDDRLHLTLTSGFDSNLCLYLAHKELGKPINVYCIGTTGQGAHLGESGRAREIAATYQDVKFHSKDLDESAICDLPNIVWRLEGICYERGIFIRNSQAKQVSQHANYLVGGDLANQVLNRYFSRSRIIKFRRRGAPWYWNPYWKTAVFDQWNIYPRQLGLFMNMKQNGLLLSTYSVQLKYLYLDRAFVDLALSLHQKLRKPHLLHQEIISKYLPQPVLEQVLKPRIEGLDETFYFQSDAFRKNITSFLLKSDFLMPLVEKKLKRLAKEFIAHNDLDKARMVTRLLYLDLWHRIFMTGDFDNTFSSNEYEYPLDHFLVN